jgi:type II secretory pathway pseudopilin PulG
MMRRSRSALTLAELLVVLLVAGALAGIATPVILRVRRAAITTACASNLRQIGFCCLAYAEDWQGLLPADGNLGATDPGRSPAWFIRLPAYDERANVGRKASPFQCAGWKGSAGTFANATPKSLKMNAYLDEDGRPPHQRLGRHRDAAQVVLFIDAIAGDTGMGQWGHCLRSAVTDQRHSGTVNWLALDGSTLSRTRPPTDGDWGKALRWVPER